MRTPLLILTVALVSQSARSVEGQDTYISANGTESCTTRTDDAHNTFPKCQLFTNEIRAFCSPQWENELLVYSLSVRDSVLHSILCEAPYPIEVAVQSSDPNLKAQVDVRYSRKFSEQVELVKNGSIFHLPVGSFRAIVSFRLRESILKSFTVQKLGSPHVNVTIVELEYCDTREYASRVKAKSAIQITDYDYQQIIIPCPRLCLTTNDDRCSLHPISVIRNFIGSSAFSPIRAIPAPGNKLKLSRIILGETIIGREFKCSPQKNLSLVKSPWISEFSFPQPQRMALRLSRAKQIFADNASTSSNTYYFYLNATNVTVSCRATSNFTLQVSYTDELIGNQSNRAESCIITYSNPGVMNGIYFAELTIQLSGAPLVYVFCRDESGFQIKVDIKAQVLDPPILDYRDDRTPTSPLLRICRNVTEIVCEKDLQRIPCKRPQDCDATPHRHAKFWETITKRDERDMLESIKEDYLGSLVVCSGKYESMFVRGLDGQLYDRIEDAPDDAKLEIGQPKQTNGLYANGTFTFVCRGHLFFTGGPVLWFTNSSKGLSAHESVHESVQSELGVVESFANITLQLDMTEVICVAPSWKTEDWVTAVAPLSEIQEPIIPILEGFDDEVLYFKIDNDATLNCIIEDSLPAATLHFEVFKNNTWLTLDNCTNHSDALKNGRLFKQGRISVTCFNCLYRGALSFLPFKAEYTGKYRCVATSELGSSIKRYEVNIDESFRIIYVALGLCMAFFAGIAIVFKTKSQFWAIQKRLFMTKEEIRQFREGLQNASEREKEDPGNLPFEERYEIHPSHLEIQKDNILGTGQSGVVYRAILSNVEGFVAVKTVKPKPGKSTEYIRSLLSEIKVMMFLGHHPHIVNFVGALTQEIQRGVLYVVSEYCERGSLEKYLREMVRPSRLYFDSVSDVDDCARDQYLPISNCSHLPLNAITGPLLRWVYEVADAMSFIASKNVIHADLASRNVLLTSDLTAKLTDFGLSRKLYEYAKYVKKSEVPVPWRSMAPESFEKLEFSTKSDVWSFGIFIWEVFEFGAVPYPGLNYDGQFVVQLLNGLRLPQPEFASNEIYEIMMSCCELEPGQRCDFESIRERIRGIIQFYASDDDHCPTEIP